jgi:hypothetical protein
VTSQTPTSASPKLTPRQLHLAVQRLNESDEVLRELRQYLHSGGRIQWVVDTDVVIHFLRPKQNRRYAEIFPGSEATGEESKGLVALSAVLADFIFSERFQLSGTASPVSPVHDVKLLLDPHTEEFHDVVSAISRDISPQAKAAKSASDGGLSRQVMKLLQNFTRGKLTGMSQEVFVQTLQDTIADSFQIILPDGPLDELRRVRDLLKERKTLIYQADNAELHSLLTEKTAAAMHDLKADVWFERLREFFGTRDHNQSDEGKDKKRPQNDLRNYRDAKVLAALELLNERGAATNLRYVFLTGQGTLSSVVQHQSQRTRTSVFIVHPRAFLGSPRLLESKEQAKTSADTTEHPIRWKRITDAVNFLGGFGESRLIQHQELIDKLYDEWRLLERMALPYLPEQAYIPDVRALAKDIFSGASLDALETQLYIAISDFFALTAELGLVAHQEPMQGTMKRKPPPLRLGFYPEAEAFIVKIVDRGLWDPDGSANTPLIGNWIERVKTEQRKEANGANLPSFNYPLLLCFAERFAAMGDWHACRLLAVQAKAVASATREALPFITGRDAAMLEGYARRLEARKVEELESAREALREFRAACLVEQKAWSDPKTKLTHDSKCVLHAFNPEREFVIHTLRADVEELTIDFAVIMFALFSADMTASDVRVELANRQSDVVGLVERISDTLVRLEAPEIFKELHVPPALNAIHDYLRIQLELCGLQCGLLLFAVGVSATNFEHWRDSDLHVRVAAHKTDVSRLAAAVAQRIWGNSREREQNLKLVKEIVELTNSSKEKLPPFDLGRARFFLHLAEERAAL